jgi:hypothetical protein
MTTEHRARTLTDEDIDELMRRLDRAWVRQAEAIGYDVTTPESRAAIHADHTWTRDFRIGSARAKVTAWGAAITTFIGASLYMLWLTLKTALSAKGAG